MLNKSVARVGLAAFLAATVMVAPLSQPAKAQTATGSTAFTINFPEVIVLHYWSQLDMTLAADQVTQFLLTQANGDDDRGTTTGVVISGGSTFSANAAVTSTLDNDPTSAQMLITNAWAVRSVTNGTQVEVELTSVPTSLSGPTSGTIAVSDFFTSTGGVGTADTITFNSPGLVNPEFGDISFVMNMSNATESGDYTGTWTIEAEIL